MSIELAEFLDRHQRIFVLTGAGVSTASGIPDYRDESGAWKHQRPMELREFVASHAARQRYWARSCLGWERFRRARPNAAHAALARLEVLGKLSRLVTQNVDGLQQLAGSRRVTELHGSLARVDCLDCGQSVARGQIQQRLLDANPVLGDLSAKPAPDGDALLQDFDSDLVEVPACAGCGGVLKPAVVFFGETLAPQCVRECNDALAQSDAALVAGSSLMVYSGFRLVRDAARLKLPVFVINRGKTRADELIDCKLEQDCGAALSAATAKLNPAPESAVF